MNKIYKTVWNALRHSLVVVNETTKSLGGQSSGSGRQQGSICAQTPARHGIQSKKCLASCFFEKTKLVSILIALFGLPSTLFAQETYYYDEYVDLEFDALNNFTLFESYGLKSLSIGSINSPAGRFISVSKSRQESSGDDGFWTPEDYFLTVLNVGSITVKNMRVETGTFNINGDINIVGKIADPLVEEALSGNNTLWGELASYDGMLFLVNAQSFEPGVVHGNVTASLIHTGGTTNEIFDVTSPYNGRIIIEGNLIADNVAIDNPLGFDTQADNVEVKGKTLISNNLYNNGYFRGSYVSVDGIFYNGHGAFYNPWDPDAVAQLPTSWVGSEIDELNSLNIVNSSNLYVNTLTNTREQTYTQTFGTIQVKNNWFTNSTINMSGGIINEDSLGPDKNLGINNVYNITGGTLIVGDLNFDSTVNLSQDGKIQTDIESIFINPDGDPEALNYIGLNASEPESVKASLTKWFTNYVAGTLRTDLEDHVNFNGGSIVVSGFGKITQTQYDDLMKAFKEAFLNSIRKDLFQA